MVGVAPKTDATTLLEAATERKDALAKRHADAVASLALLNDERTKLARKFDQLDEDSIKRRQKLLKEAFDAQALVDDLAMALQDAQSEHSAAERGKKESRKKEIRRDRAKKAKAFVEIVGKAQQTIALLGTQRAEILAMAKELDRLTDCLGTPNPLEGGGGMGAALARQLARAGFGENFPSHWEEAKRDKLSLAERGEHIAAALDGLEVKV